MPLTATDVLKAFAPIVIAAIALVVSLLGYRIARRNERRSIESTKPLITAQVYRVKDQPGWLGVSFSVESRTSHGYRLNSIVFHKPWGSRGLRQQQAQQPKDLSQLKVPLPLDEAVRKLPMHFEIAKAGVTRTSPFSSSVQWGAVYVHVRPWPWSRWLSMRFNLSSIEAEERETVLTVRRKIPAVANKITD